MQDHVDIAVVSNDASGRLSVAPAPSSNSDFSFIYRAAKEVAWNPETGALIGGLPRTWSRARWLQQIAEAVESEYGIKLRVTSSTNWIDIPDGDRREIEAWSKQAQQSVQPDRREDAAPG
jgi:hypothetical protein